MAGFKEGLHGNVEGIRKRGQEATDTGERIAEEASEVKRRLDSISVQDDEDIRAVETAEQGYKPAFDGAFSDQVETIGQEVADGSEQIKSESETELGNVRDGISQMEAAAGASEIGRENAEQGRSALEGSATEYEGIIQDAETVEQETDQSIKSLRSKVDSVFN